MSYEFWTESVLQNYLILNETKQKSITPMGLCFPHSIPYFVFYCLYVLIGKHFYFVFLNEYGKQTSGLHSQALTFNTTVLSVKQSVLLKTLTV
jgi:hypothetical protein